MKLDILAIGVHPDDVELGCSGTLINEVRQGKKVGILDLTESELSSRGTVESRRSEAADAAAIIGAVTRENLGMADGFFKNDGDHQRLLIRAIRKYRPEIIIANILEDRHPDHGRAGHLISDASFLSGLIKIETTDENGAPQEKWRPKMILHYLQDSFHEPDLIIDVTDSFEQRMRSIKAYSTQFFTPESDAGGLQTYISTPDFIDAIVARSRLLGKRIGVKYGEGFVTTKKIGLRSLDSLILVET
jgi:bacillithiol biosynthesis deacetylase BshB1